MSGALETSTLAASKRAGENAEAAVIDTIDGLAPVAGEEHYDAIAETAIFPSHDRPFVGICVLEADLPVEIKSTMAVYGEQQRRGRFKLRRNQHDALTDANGAYLFVVCEPRPDRQPIAMKVVPAGTIGDLVDAVASWRDEGDARGPKAQIAWSRVFDPAEIEG
ncbi:hypothetical protein GWK26_11815 [haloarchaeon 3A1-DGR]|nr:hypothetical protein GWK26_11815 [haloarchaeon 3A1-DGR]